MAAPTATDKVGAKNRYVSLAVCSAGRLVYTLKRSKGVDNVSVVDSAEFTTVAGCMLCMRVLTYGFTSCVVATGHTGRRQTFTHIKVKLIQ